MTDTASRIYVVTVTDGAAFNATLGQAAFATWEEANEQGRIRVAQLRAQRRLGGETDPAYVEAITHDVQPLPMGETWGRSKPSRVKRHSHTPRGDWASCLTRAGDQRRRLSAGGHTERFARHQFELNREGFLGNVRRDVDYAKRARTPHPWGPRFASLDGGAA